MYLFTISDFVYIRFSHFNHFGILKNSTIDLPISILLGSLQPIEHSFIVFWLCLHKLSHFFSHLKTKKYRHNKAVLLSFQKMYTFTTLRSSPKSVTSFRDMLDPKRSKFGPKRAQNGRGLTLLEYKHQFSKRRP